LKEIKISGVYSLNRDSIESTILYNLIRVLSKKKIIYSSPNQADILFIGPYNINTIANRFNIFLKKNRHVVNLIF
jgi:hypothetical protein